MVLRGFPGSSNSKTSAYNAGDLGSIPGSGRSPGEGNGNPLQYSCLENPMDWGAWWATIHGVAKSRTWLSNFTFTFFHVCIGFNIQKTQRGLMTPFCPDISVIQFLQRRQFRYLLFTNNRYKWTNSSKGIREPTLEQQHCLQGGS